MATTLVRQGSERNAREARLQCELARGVTWAVRSGFAARAFVNVTGQLEFNVDHRYQLHVPVQQMVLRRKGSKTGSHGPSPWEDPGGGGGGGSHQEEEEEAGVGHHYHLSQVCEAVCAQVLDALDFVHVTGMLRFNVDNRRLVRMTVSHMVLSNPDSPVSPVTVDADRLSPAPHSPKRENPDEGKDGMAAMIRQQPVMGHLVNDNKLNMFSPSRAESNVSYNDKHLRMLTFGRTTQVQQHTQSESSLILQLNTPSPRIAHHPQPPPVPPEPPGVHHHHHLQARMDWGEADTTGYDSGIEPSPSGACFFSPPRRCPSAPLHPPLLSPGVSVEHHQEVGEQEQGPLHIDHGPYNDTPDQQDDVSDQQQVDQYQQDPGMGPHPGLRQSQPLWEPKTSPQEAWNGGHGVPSTAQQPIEVSDGDNASTQDNSQEDILDEQMKASMKSQFLAGGTCSDNDDNDNADSQPEADTSDDIAEFQIEQSYIGRPFTRCYLQALKAITTQPVDISEEVKTADAEKDTRNSTDNNSECSLPPEVSVNLQQEHNADDDCDGDCEMTEDDDCYDNQERNVAKDNNSTTKEHCDDGCHVDHDRDVTLYGDCHGDLDSHMKGCHGDNDGNITEDGDRHGNIHNHVIRNGSSHATEDGHRHGDGDNHVRGDSNRHSDRGSHAVKGEDRDHVRDSKVTEDRNYHFDKDSQVTRKGERGHNVGGNEDCNTDGKEDDHNSDKGSHVTGDGSGHGNTLSHLTEGGNCHRDRDNHVTEQADCHGNRGIHETGNDDCHGYIDNHVTEDSDFHGDGDKHMTMGEGNSSSDQDDDNATYFGKIKRCRPTRSVRHGKRLRIANTTRRDNRNCSSISKRDKWKNTRNSENHKKSGNQKSKPTGTLQKSHKSKVLEESGDDKEEENNLEDCHKEKGCRKIRQAQNTKSVDNTAKDETKSAEPVNDYSSGDNDLEFPKIYDPNEKILPYSNMKQLQCSECSFSTTLTGLLRYHKLKEHSAWKDRFLLPSTNTTKGPNDTDSSDDEVLEAQNKKGKDKLTAPQSKKGKDELTAPQSKKGKCEVTESQSKKEVLEVSADGEFSILVPGTYQGATHVKVSTSEDKTARYFIQRNAAGRNSSSSKRKSKKLPPECSGLMKVCKMEISRIDGPFPVKKLPRYERESETDTLSDNSLPSFPVKRRQRSPSPSPSRKDTSTKGKKEHQRKVPPKSRIRKRSHQNTNKSKKSVENRKHTQSSPYHPLSESTTEEEDNASRSKKFPVNKKAKQPKRIFSMRNSATGSCEEESVLTTLLHRNRATYTEEENKEKKLSQQARLKAIYAEKSNSLENTIKRSIVDVSAPSTIPSSTPDTQMKEGEDESMQLCDAESIPEESDFPSLQNKLNHPSNSEKGLVSDDGLPTLSFLEIGSEVVVEAEKQKPSESKPAKLKVIPETPNGRGIKRCVTEIYCSPSVSTLEGFSNVEGKEVKRCTPAIENSPSAVSGTSDDSREQCHKSSSTNKTPASEIRSKFTKEGEQYPAVGDKSKPTASQRITIGNARAHEKDKNKKLIPSDSKDGSEKENNQSKVQRCIPALESSPFGFQTSDEDALIIDKRSQEETFEIDSHKSYSSTSSARENEFSCNKETTIHLQKPTTAAIQEVQSVTSTVRTDNQKTTPEVDIGQQSDKTTTISSKVVSTSKIKRSRSDAPKGCISQSLVSGEKEKGSGGNTLGNDYADTSDKLCKGTETSGKSKTGIECKTDSTKKLTTKSICRNTVKENLGIGSGRVSPPKSSLPKVTTGLKTKASRHSPEMKQHSTEYGSVKKVSKSVDSGKGSEVVDTEEHSKLRKDEKRIPTSKDVKEPNHSISLVKNVAVMDEDKLDDIPPFKSSDEATVDYTTNYKKEIPFGPDLMTKPSKTEVSRTIHKDEKCHKCRSHMLTAVSDIKSSTSPKESKHHLVASDKAKTAASLTDPTSLEIKAVKITEPSKSLSRDEKQVTPDSMDSTGRSSIHEINGPAMDEDELEDILPQESDRNEFAATQKDHMSFAHNDLKAEKATLMLSPKSTSLELPRIPGYSTKSTEGTSNEHDSTTKPPTRDISLTSAKEDSEKVSRRDKCNDASRLQIMTAVSDINVKRSKFPVGDVQLLMGDDKGESAISDKAVDMRVAGTSESATPKMDKLKVSDSKEASDRERLQAMLFDKEIPAMDEDELDNFPPAKYSEITGDDFKQKDRDTALSTKDSKSQNLKFSSEGNGEFDIYATKHGEDEQMAALEDTDCSELVSGSTKKLDSLDLQMNVNSRKDHRDGSEDVSEVGDEANQKVSDDERKKSKPSSLQHKKFRAGNIIFHFRVRDKTATQSVNKNKTPDREPNTTSVVIDDTSEKHHTAKPKPIPLEPKILMSHIDGKSNVQKKGTSNNPVDNHNRQPHNGSTNFYEKERDQLGRFCCLSCTFKTSHVKMYISHIQNHHQMKKHYLCNVCGELFKRSNLFEMHLYKHKKSLEDCGKGKDPNESNHVRYTDTESKHNGKGRKGHKHYDSQKVSKSLSTGTAEKSLSHRNHHTIKCPYCPAQNFPDEKSLRDHKDLCHPYIKISRRKHKAKCDICNKKFDSESVVEKHILMKHPLTCSICRIKFCDEESFTDHKETSHKSEYTCKECGKKCATDLSLKTHMRMMHISRCLAEALQQKPPNVPQCESDDDNAAEGTTKEKAAGTKQSGAKNTDGVKKSKFPREEAESSLSTISIQEDRTRSCCYVCLSIFHTTKTLKAHLLKHSIEMKEHMCMRCGQQFSENDQLTNHMVIKHSEELYKCNICGLVCQTFQVLSTHKRSHHESKTCRYCDKVMKSEWHRQKHEKWHEKHQLLKCGICQDKFENVSSLVQHRVSQHPKKSVHHNKSHTVTQASIESSTATSSSTKQDATCKDDSDDCTLAKSDLDDLFGDLPEDDPLNSSSFSDLILNLDGTRMSMFQSGLDSSNDDECATV